MSRVEDDRMVGLPVAPVVRLALAVLLFSSVAARCEEPEAEEDTDLVFCFDRDPGADHHVANIKLELHAGGADRTESVRTLLFPPEKTVNGCFETSLPTAASEKSDGGGVPFSYRSTWTLADGAVHEGPWVEGDGSRQHVGRPWREIVVVPHGEAGADFERFVDRVIVELRKQHEVAEETTLRRTELTLEEVATGGAVLTYPRVAGDEAQQWLDYDYRVVWRMLSGSSSDSGWQRSRAAVILLEPPYSKIPLEVVCDWGELEKISVEAAVVRLHTEVFGERRSERVLCARPRQGGEREEVREVELLGPSNSRSYAFEVTWVLDSGKRKTFAGRSEEAVLFVDALSE